jgi:hypothetical protein
MRPSSPAIACHHAISVAARAGVASRALTTQIRMRPAKLGPLFGPRDIL